MTMKTVTAAQAKTLRERGAVIVDIREPGEFAREHIAGAKNAPLSTIGGTQAHIAGDIVVYHCKSGMRTKANAHKLPADTCEAYILEGGIDSWKGAGFGVETDASKPIEITRQVQIAAGSLVLIGVLLAALVHPAFVLLSALVGAGLVYTGVSGFCGMAKLLGVMPWNRHAV